MATVLKDTGRKIWFWTQLGIGTAVLIWASIFLVHFWNTSPTLRLNEIKFYGDIPENLPDSLSIKPGQNVFLLQISREEKKILREFPELRSISLWRTPFREIIVRGDFRIPVALSQKDGKTFGIDLAGFVFPIHKWNSPKETYPFITEFKRAQLPDLMRALTRLRKEAPDFYSLISRLETDTINSVNVELRDKIFVVWGPLEPEVLMIKAGRVLEVLNNFVPIKKPAVLRFVTENRVVIDANWMAKAEEKI